MNIGTTLISNQGERRWRQFWFLLLVFFMGGMISSELPTPDSWSDGRSQWLPAAAIGIITFGLIVATFWIYQRPGIVFKIQAVILWLFFGIVMVACIVSLYEAFIFLREVRAHR